MDCSSGREATTPRSDAATTPPDLLLLHVLRCGGFAPLSRVAAATGLDESDVESGLIEMGAAGLVTRTSGIITGWGLTERGRGSAAERIAAELAAAGARATVTAAFERFLELNPELLDLCTAWQLRTVGGAPAVNNHDDPAYDARVLGRFADLHDRVGAVCAELTAVLPRFGRYHRRLADALDHARAGDIVHVTDSTTSFHTVWAELHEDLLATLGLPR